MPDRSKLYRDANNEWRWRRSAPNGDKVGASTEGDINKQDAIDNYVRNEGAEAPALEEEA